MEGKFMLCVAISIQFDIVLTLGQTNLALNKECRQSSQLFSNSKYSPGVAVDGDTQQKMKQEASCSHTEHYEPFNWWTVDLGQQYTVDTITIYNRADPCCDDRLADYDVLVYNPVISTWEDYNKSTPDICYHHDGISPLVINITCPTGTIGRFVQIYKQNGVDFNITEQPLTLCEVEVYGPRNLTDPADTVIETTTGNILSTDESICQCPCVSSAFAWSSNYTKEELQIIMSEELEDLKRELRVRRSILTSSLRKLNSAGDNRTSSKSIGIAAAIFLIIVVCLIILLDLIRLKSIKVKRKTF
ncbi:unnamed protein product [Mytilus edulis]|uniref:F5/8 type C domain-containing protein n=1 Tax=Mytilus edulis TaxID=6550 RepID=A0A8S3Q4E6_MYTED|nr:unnamed protein product [Mytilus edulis]